MTHKIGDTAYCREENELNSNFNFGNWLKQNELENIKHIFVDYNINTSQSLNLYNENFVKYKK